MNYKDMLVAVDLDGTLCESGFNGKNEPLPREDIIGVIEGIYKDGAHIIIYTARHPKYYQITLAWLVKYGVQFHGIAMRYKPSCDLYIDDKSIKPGELL